MKILCAKKRNKNSSCYSFTKKKNLKSCTIPFENKDNCIILYKTIDTYITRKGFKIPKNVNVLKWDGYLYGINSIDEIAIAIPVTDQNKIDNKVFDFDKLIVCVPINILKSIN